MKHSYIIIFFISIFTFFLVFSPHLEYPYPYHIDEWHHITESKRLVNGEYPLGTIGYRLGFHIFLAILAIPLDLIQIYKFLPAILAVISSLILFYTVYKKTNNVNLGLLSMLFFASIKSNVNITGLWFFTPLTFSIPLIFLYFYFFSEGFEKQNKKYISISLIIMLLLIFIHSISFLFALPILLIYSLTNLKYIKKEYKFFLLFLLIPILGLFFYKIMNQISFTILLSHIFDSLQFKHGWGILELNNSFLELYSIIGYALAILGFLLIAFSKQRSKYLLYLLWPIIVLISIYIYRLSDISFLSPYQRNLYYFVLSLPFFSAYGLHFILSYIKTTLNKKEEKKINKNKKKKIINNNILSTIISTIIIIIVIILTFISYYTVPKNITLYELIDEHDYESLTFLSKLDKAKTIAPPDISTTMYAISGHTPVGTIAFYGNRDDIEEFFYSSNCSFQDSIIKKHNVKYILSREEISCNYKEIYYNVNYIYEIRKKV